MMTWFTINRRHQPNSGGGQSITRHALTAKPLTNAFAKKLENHAAMVALYFMFSNFARVHQTLRVTPAMEAGIGNHVWAIEEIVPCSNEEGNDAED